MSKSGGKKGKAKRAGTNSEAVATAPAATQPAGVSAPAIESMAVDSTAPAVTATAEPDRLAETELEMEPPAEVKPRERATSPKRIATSVASAAKKAPTVIVEDAKVVAAVSQPYLKAAVEKERAAASGDNVSDGSEETNSTPTASRPGPVGTLAAGVTERLVEKVVGLVANEATAHKVGVAAGKAAGEAADRAAIAAAERAVQALTANSPATDPEGSTRSESVEAGSSDQPISRRPNKRR